jgi:hypothetical protein
VSDQAILGFERTPMRLTSRKYFMPRRDHGTDPPERGILIHHVSRVKATLMQLKRLSLSQRRPEERSRFRIGWREWSL